MAIGNFMYFLRNFLLKIIALFGLVWYYEPLATLEKKQILQLIFCRSYDFPNFRHAETKACSLVAWLLSWLKNPYTPWN